MAELNLIKRNGALYPSLEVDEETLSKWPDGEILRTKTEKPRNGAFHRKFFALMQVVFENQSKYDTLTDLLTEIKLKTGFYKTHITTKGNLIYIPESISYAKMDEIEFDKFYQKAIDICLKHFCIGSTQEEIEKQVLIVLSFT
jgi:hypothetical protein